MHLHLPTIQIHPTALQLGGLGLELDLDRYWLAWLTSIDYLARRLGSTFVFFCVLNVYSQKVKTQGQKRERKQKTFQNLSLSLTNSFKDVLQMSTTAGLGSNLRKFLYNKACSNRAFETEKIVGISIVLLPFG